MCDYGLSEAEEWYADFKLEQAKRRTKSKTNYDRELIELEDEAMSDEGEGE
jgi:hypothetical protein